jgi:predicted PurR-regulated permease PerM
VLIAELAVLVGLVLVFIAGRALAQVSHFIIVVTAAALVAFLVAPGVGRMQALTGNRVIATGLVYLGILLVVGVGLTLIAGPLVREGSEFARELPSYAARVPDWAAQLEGLAAGWGVELQLTQLVRQAAGQLQVGGALVLGGTVGVVAGVTSVLADIAVVLVLSFYLSVDGPRLRDRVHDRLPLRYQPFALRLEGSVRRVFGGYVRGQLILGVTIGLLAGLGAAFFKLPYPVLPGVLAGLFELIPMFGSLLGAVPSLIAALFLPFPTVLLVGLFFLIINQAENYLLAPRITGESLGLSPLATLVALLLGIELAGFLGAVIAVPLAAVAVDLFRPGGAAQPPVEDAGQTPA